MKLTISNKKRGWVRWACIGIIGAAAVSFVSALASRALGGPPVATGYKLVGQSVQLNVYRRDDGRYYAVPSSGDRNSRNPKTGDWLVMTAECIEIQWLGKDGPLWWTFSGTLIKLGRAQPGVERQRIQSAIVPQVSALGLAPVTHMSLGPKASMTASAQRRRWAPYETWRQWLAWTGKALPYILGAALVLVFIDRVERARYACPHCAYDLRGLPRHTRECPECGSPFRRDATGNPRR